MQTRTPVHTTNAMLPTLKVILTSVITACAVVLALSAGLIATRDPSDRLSGVPSMSRPMVRQAIVDDTEWQSSQMLAYSRRADELQRLRDLPSAPARAVVEYAERAQKAAEPAPADTADGPPAPAPTVIATAPAAPPVPTAEPAEQPAPPSELVSAADAAPAPQPLPAEASAPAVPAPPVEVASTPAASAPPAEIASAPAVPAPAPVASAPAVLPPAAPIAEPAPAEAPPAPAVTAAITQPAPAAEPTPAAANGTQVATIQSGSGETNAVKPTDQPADTKSQHHPKRHGRRDTHKKPVRVARTSTSTNTSANGTNASTTVPPSAQTGFPIDLPQSQKPKATKSSGMPDTRQDSRAGD